MATISRFRAVATVGPFRLSGFIGWFSWLLVHLAFLTGFKNRVATIASWTHVHRPRPSRASDHRPSSTRTGSPRTADWGAD
jgi:NADH dehydrogenase FAD-containing subunit